MFLSFSLSKKLVYTSVFLFISLFTSILLFSGNNSASLDSDNKNIVEEIDTEDESFIKKIIPQESPVTSAILFAGNLESKLSGIFRGTNTINALGGPDESSVGLETVGNALVAQGSVLAIIPASAESSVSDGNILTYEVEAGDSLESIADDFGISVDTLLSANNLPKGTKLKIGDKISILPVDGVRHTVKLGDTIKSIAIKYNADEARILAFNGLPDDGRIVTGQTLTIPGGEFHVPISTKYAPAQSPSPDSLPNIAGYYGRPSNGRVTFGLHRFNAVDIGGHEWCNTPLYASAAGTVITADAQGWNGGYGRYIKISHDNGTITLYAHASQLLIGEGVKVKKGQTIALMGSTGNATGCHVHFEIRGAKNPFTN
ncbi:MAG: M23 family metallopeptidase [bacterium]|nr:M23 family metallopeptidase [bacterium]